MPAATSVDTITNPASAAMTSALSMKGFPCNTCDLKFEDSPTQRAHMRSSWHVYNLKRRLSELPAISEDNYNTKIATPTVSRKHRPLRSASPIQQEDEPAEQDTKDRTSIETPEPPSEYHCLFCLDEMPNVDENLSHMSSAHSLHIPQLDNLSNLGSLISYLHTIITVYHECLSCGATKSTSKAARRHMLDKGHCMINLEREPELLEFWDLLDSDNDDQIPDMTNSITDDEYILPSGRVVTSKNKSRSTRRHPQRPIVSEQFPQAIPGASSNDTALTSVISHPEMDLTNDLSGRALTKRDAAGLVGVSDQQVRSLATLQRKMQRQQAVVVASFPWADELGGRGQKHFKKKMDLRSG